MNARMQKTAGSSILWDLVSAEPSTDLLHFAPTIVLFIVKPLSKNRLRWLLHRLRCAGFLDCKNCPVESQRKFWPALGFLGILKNFCHKELTEFPGQAETLNPLITEVGGCR
jgi:hypothetical protein